MERNKLGTKDGIPNGSKTKDKTLKYVSTVAALETKKVVALQNRYAELAKPVRLKLSGGQDTQPLDNQNPLEQAAPTWGK